MHVLRYVSFASKDAESVKIMDMLWGEEKFREFQKNIGMVINLKLMFLGIPNSLSGDFYSTRLLVCIIKNPTKVTVKINSCNLSANIN